MRVIGIDPGLSGAIAVINGDDSLMIFDMPTMTVERNGKAKRQVSATELADLLYLYSGKDCHVYCERVGAMAGQGVTSVFS
jgi:crossover junction endodeoxyribonuclease RuvC